jgi:hypothetical protein
MRGRVRRPLLRHTIGFFRPRVGQSELKGLMPGDAKEASATAFAPSARSRGAVS